MAFLILTPFVPIGAQGHVFYEGDLEEFSLAEQDVESALATINEIDGFIYKAAPVEGESDRSAFTDYLTYTVKPGETLSSIAGDFRLSVETIKMVNGIYNTNSVRAGSVLEIPPVDGVLHTVAAKDTVESIAKKYKAEAEDIISQNDLEEGSTLEEGLVLIVPGGKQEIPQPVRIIANNNTANYNGLSQADFAPAINSGGGWVWPVPAGTITTQRFGGPRGHGGLDLAKRSGGPIYAAADGVVSRADGDGYNGGYGKVAVVNNGNGIQTLYAHLSQIYVQPGQVVSAGDVIGLMGTTGRSTGVHLHFEVIVHGIKRNPMLWY